jgi:phytanoyl-CoA hydroxylase
MKQTQGVIRELRDTFAEQGFLKLDRFFEEDECDALRVRILEIIATHDDGSSTEFSTIRGEHPNDLYFVNSGDKIRFFYEKNASQEGQNNALNRPRLLNKIGHALHDLDRVFNHFSRHEKFKQLSLDLGLERALLLQSMYIFKQPYIGGEVTCHQDGTFLASEPDTIIGLWVALEDATIENGCLWVIPGGHHEPLRTCFVRDGDVCNYVDYAPLDFDLAKLVPLEIKKGGVIVLHSRLPHMSHENKSGKSRHAYTLHIMDANSRFLSHNWLRRAPHLPFRDFDNKPL